jgi:hypothetical protein
MILNDFELNFYIILSVATKQNKVAPPPSELAAGLWVSIINVGVTPFPFTVQQTGWG